MGDGSTFKELREAILQSIASLDRDLREVRAEQVKQGKLLAALAVKASLWGGLGGVVAAALAILLLFLKDWLSN